MEYLQRILRSLAWGVAAALTAWALDELTASLTLGHAIPVNGPFIAAYLVTGALIAGLVHVALLRRRPPSGFRIFAVTLGVIYAASAFERVEHALEKQVAMPVALAVATCAVLGFALWIFVLRLVASSRAPDLDVTSAAVSIAALGLAVGLAVNRNVVNRPLESAALLADAAVLLGGFALAWILRAAGVRATLAAAVLLVVGPLLAIGDRPGSPGLPDRGEGPSGGRPHLVLVIVDTLRQDVFRAVVDETREGRDFKAALGNAAWFSNLISTAPWTAPSVASIMTGLFPPEHHFGTVKGEDSSRPIQRLSSSVPTIAGTLRDRGYRTVGIVTNPLLHPVSGMARGYERYELLGGPTTKLPLLTVLASLRLVERDYYQRAGAVRRRLRVHLEAVAGGSAPVFVWLHLMDPHFPLHPHDDLSPDPLGEELPEDERLYRDEIRYALRELRRMLELFEAKGLWDDTVFVLLSDHGEMFRTDGHRPPGNSRPWGHGHALYDELVRVPLVIRPPGGLPSERRVGVLASQVDLYGTVTDLLGLDAAPAGPDRVSLAPWLAPELPAAGPEERTYALSGSPRTGPPLRSVSTTSLKLIRYPRSPVPDELYDLGSDPREQNNLAANDARLAELRELLDYTWSRLESAAQDDRPLVYDEETRKRLEALGYVD